MVDKAGLNAHAVQDLVDLRPAAVDQHHLHAHQVQKDDVLHHRGEQLLADHGVSAVFHHNDFAVILLNIRQRLHQDLRPLVVLISNHRHKIAFFFLFAGQ